MHARKWLPALLAVACLTGCGGKTNDSSQPATTTTITNSPGDSIVTKLSDVADDIGDAGKDLLTDIGDAAEDVKDDLMSETTKTHTTISDSLESTESTETTTK